jgi:phosphoglycerate kinase
MEKNWKEHLFEDYSEFKGKRVIIRLDWNLPMHNDDITDTSRAEVTFEFLKKLSFAGVKMILMTHFGEKGESLAPLVPFLQKHLPFMTFTEEKSFEKLAAASHALHDGDAMLLENVRQWNGEEENIPSLGRSFSDLGDIFVNNAFSVSHRKHASVVGIPKNILSYLGPLFVRELEHLTLALNPEKPALMIIGGAKIKTKLALIEKYLDKGVRVFVGGAMVHDIWRNKGIEIGESLHDATISLSETFVNHPLLMTPVDVILSTGETVPHYNIPKDGVVVDCGEDTVKLIASTIKESKTVIANGPLGLYEKGWLKGTEGVLTILGGSETTSYIGGGDTVAVAHSLHLLRKFDFVSLGGGAMLDFLANGTLPGIHAVTESKQAGYR